METAVKMLAFIVAAALVIALTLAAMGRITWRLFWMIAIATAIIAYYVIPALRKKAAP
jgi:hypothetical protein